MVPRSENPTRQSNSSPPEYLNLTSQTNDLLRVDQWVSKATQGERTLSKRIAGQIDAYVGRRIRLGRTLLGMTQDHLATLLGVTYQQLQKYEKGVNRISAGRLIQVAGILGVPVDFFYEDVTRSQLDPGEQLSPRIVEFLGTEEGVQLGKAFIRIKAPQVRRGLLDLIRLLAKDDLPIDDSL